ncbi:hypothetical protein D3C75_872330 [compost metagenome]
MEPKAGVCWQDWRCLAWGLAGICPGAALVLLGSGLTEGMLSLLSILGGVTLFEALSADHAASAPRLCKTS